MDGDIEAIKQRTEDDFGAQPQIDHLRNEAVKLRDQANLLDHRAMLIELRLKFRPGDHGFRPEAALLGIKGE